MGRVGWPTFSVWDMLVISKTESESISVDGFDTIVGAYSVAGEAREDSDIAAREEVEVDELECESDGTVSERGRERGGVVIGAVDAGCSISVCEARRCLRLYRTHIQQLTHQHTASLTILTAIHAWNSRGWGHASEGTD